MTATIVLGAVVMTLVQALWAQAAFAYTYDTPVSEGCHEVLALEALELAEASNAGPGPVEATSDERALIRDLPFNVTIDPGDLARATLLLAVRDNDLKGRHPTDTDQLAVVHGDPALQHEHCLRHPEHDGEDGAEAALAACRAFIVSRALSASTGLDPNGKIVSSERTGLTVWLALRGKVEAHLPTAYVRLGQALHALQDSFTHAFRTSNGLRVTTVLNWVEYVNDELDRGRDGPPHMEALDRCDNSDALLARNRKLAVEASAALIRATSAPAELREAQIRSVVEKYLGFAAGCTEENRWCDAPELAYEDSGACACRFADGRTSSGAALVGLACLLLRRAWRCKR